MPEVHRWPYDYNKHGREFIPQTEPLSQYEIEHGEHGDEGDSDIIKKEERDHKDDHV